MSMQERKDAARLEEIKGLIKIKLAEKCKFCWFIHQPSFVLDNNFLFVNVFCFLEKTLGQEIADAGFN